MSLLRIIGAIIVFIFIGIVGFFTLLVKILGALFSTPKGIPQPRQKNAETEQKNNSNGKSSASNDIIEVEVISVRKEDDLK